MSNEMLDAFRYRLDEFFKINKPSSVSNSVTRALTACRFFWGAEAVNGMLILKVAEAVKAFGGGM